MQLAQCHSRIVAPSHARRVGEQLLKGWHHIIIRRGSSAPPEHIRLCHPWSDFALVDIGRLDPNNACDLMLQPIFVENGGAMFVAQPTICTAATYGTLMGFLWLAVVTQILQSILDRVQLTPPLSALVAVDSFVDAVVVQNLADACSVIAHRSCDNTSPRSGNLARIEHHAAARLCVCVCTQCVRSLAQCSLDCNAK